VGYVPEEHSGVSGFRFFLDGVQSSHLIAYVGNVPLVYHQSAGVILQRDPHTRALRLWKMARCECVLVPFPYLPPNDLVDLGVPVEDTLDQSQDVPLEAQALRTRAHVRAQRLRRKLEVDLVKEWVASGEEGWLLVDGPLVLPDMPPQARAAGAIKSSRVPLFTGSEQLAVLNLPAGYRTTAFQVPRGSAAPGDEPSERARRWCSWYLRVRENDERDLEFGLLRVEAPAETVLPEDADMLSRWLMAERTPLAARDARWDNLLYPIHACERYLRSQLPNPERLTLRLRAAAPTV
jgi:hypothetical protein